MEMDQVSLTPQRVAANTTYSKQLILQGGGEVDALIANELAAAMNAYIDDYGFDAIMASTAVNQTSVADGALSTTIVNNLERDALAQGANLANSSYVMSPGAYGLTKVLAQVGNVTPLWENGRFNMYNAVATPYLVNGFLEDGTTAAAGAMCFGNFAQGAIMAYFGGIDLLVDPYSAAGTAQIKLHVNRFFDFDLRQPKALSIAKHLNA
jgi:HK97 family phage major capsid protein